MDEETQNAQGSRRGEKSIVLQKYKSRITNSMEISTGEMNE